MANVTEISQFDSGIYQLETTDVVEGGALGVDNYQAKGLANRTRWLKDQITELFRFKAKNRGALLNLNIASKTVGQTYSITGNFVSATKTANLSSGDVIRLVMTTSMGNTNYKVNLSVESVGNFEDDNEIKQLVWKKINATTFDIFIEELGNFTQNINVYFDVISLD